MSTNSGSNDTNNIQTVDTPTGMKVSLKNTFLNVDDASNDLSMPDLLRAQTTPAMFNALQALYNNASAFQPVTGESWQPPMEAVSEYPSSHRVEPEEPPPPFDAEDVLRQISEITETLSALNYDLGSTSSPERSISPELIESTTVMLRNIPNKYTAEKLLEQFGDLGFRTRDFDFFYLPIDFRNKCNVGYAFVNFRGHATAVRFMSDLEGRRLPATNSTKVCALCWARVQGRQANVDHYKDSPIAAEYRPWLFRVDGEREAFPDPDPLVMEAIAQGSQEALRAANATKGPDANKIFVGGLDKNIVGADIVQYFSQFGPVRDAAVVIDRTSGKSRGFGFCLFERFVPKNLFDRTHTIKGVQVAIKSYEGGTRPSTAH